MYPEILNQMKLHNEKQKDIAILLDLDISQVSRKLSGYIEFSLEEAKALCEHYKMSFEELFRKEN